MGSSMASATLQIKAYFSHAGRMCFAKVSALSLQLGVSNLWYGCYGVGYGMDPRGSPTCRTPAPWFSESVAAGVPAPGTT